MEIRQRILNACQEIAITKGFYKMTVDELAAQAGISKRTLYRRFRSKEDILEAAINAFLEDTSHEMDEIVKHSSELDFILDHLISYIVRRGNFLLNARILQDLNLYYPYLWEKIDRFRLEHIQILLAAAGVFDHLRINPEASKIVLSTALIASIQAVINPSFLLQNNLDFEETIKIIKQLFIAGINPSTADEQ